MAAKFDFKFKMDFKSILEKNTNWVLGCALLIFFLLDYFLLMQPQQLRPIMKLGPEAKQKAVDLKQAHIDIKSIEQYKQQVIELKKTMKGVGHRISSKEEIPKVLDSISRLAISSNVRINQIMPLRDSKKLELSNDQGKYYSMSILITALGGYHDIGQFFNQIENNEIFMSISNFDIVANAADPLIHSVTLTIKTFILEKEIEKDS